ncbi:membrane-associated oxidoreductase [Streptomyces sp. 549]|uniref:membrane-associated oxidoreductase n=1 Tax=Streptomyces sp. 549 TaxID=3049076 RepID=UPI0024C39170|nr:membrane-associated oxidoreductase [Streptomyces sp. 549]MDK1472077.1 membrane-associated oxidoreductase [Streptomyces sp. 549]
METDELTPAERRVWRAFPHGDMVDFRSSPGERPEEGAGWGPERTLRATVLRTLLLSVPAADGAIASLGVVGARVSGQLELKYSDVDVAVRFRDCYFERAPKLYSTRLRLLSFRGSHLPGLTAAAARVDGTLRLSDCRIHGMVKLGGAQVSGALMVDGATIGTEPDTPHREPVLQLNQMEIAHDLRADRLTVNGQLRLSGASISGSVFLHRARLRAPGDTALQAERLAVGADIHAMHLRVDGRVNIRGCRVPGQLNLSHARLANPGDVALRASSCTVGELWLREAEPVVGLVNLRRSVVEVLHVAPQTWPEAVQFDALSYTTLVPHEPAEQRLPVLERDRDGYVPFAYEQLTAAYRRIGDDHGARTVQLAKQRRHRGTLPWYARIWGHIQDAAVGYGFKPLRAAGWLTALLAVGTAAFASERPRPLKDDEAPAFSAFFYTLDLLLPVVGFGQEGAFTSQGWRQGLSYALIVTGWVLATTVAAGVTRALSRN